VTDVTTGAPGTPKRGTLVTMLAAEAETVGAFAGIASPLVQLGTLISVIAFIRHPRSSSRRRATNSQDRMDHRKYRLTNMG
jgi:hypothetical protein